MKPWGKKFSKKEIEWMGHLDGERMADMLNRVTASRVAPHVHHAARLLACAFVCRQLMPGSPQVFEASLMASEFIMDSYEQVEDDSFGNLVAKHAIVDIEYAKGAV